MKDAIDMQIQLVRLPKKHLQFHIVNCKPQTNETIKWRYLLTYRRNIPSKFLGANLPLTTNLCCPSSDPLVPSSASKKAMTWSGCRCILKVYVQGKNREMVIQLERRQKTLNKHVQKSNSKHMQTRMNRAMWKQLIYQKKY